MRLLDTINSIFPKNIIDIFEIIHTTPAHIFVAILLLLVLIFKNIIKQYVRKSIKLKFYRLREKVLYRLLFLRFDTLAIPMMRLLDFFIIHQILKLFISNKVVELTIFFGYLFFFVWCSYQLSKFFIHFNLAMKILKKRVNRRRLFYHLYLNIAKVIIFIIVLVVSLSKIGVDLQTLLTSLGIGGAVLIFSAKNTLTNFFDSIILISEDAFRQGDLIQTADISGNVSELGLLSTKIRTFENALVTVPNSILAHTYIKNWTTREYGRRIKLNLKLKFSNDTKEIDKVVKGIREMLSSHPNIVNQKKIQKYIKKVQKKYQEEDVYNTEDRYGIKRNFLVYFDSIDDYSMNILVYAFSSSTDWEEWLQTKEEILKYLINIVNNSKLSLAYPSHDIYMKSVNKS